MKTGDPLIDEFTAKAVRWYRYLSQDQVWLDVAGTAIRIDDMSVRYKRNALGFLARRASRLGSYYSWGSSMSVFGGVILPCVRGVDGNGHAVECAAARTGNEWAHGVYHGSGPSPDSMAALVLEGEQEREQEQIRLDPVRWLHSTALGGRLRHDVNHRIGGHVGDAVVTVQPAPSARLRPSAERTGA